LTTFADTNVLLDIATQNPLWRQPSLVSVGNALARGSLIINDAVYAELSVGFELIEEVDVFLRTINAQSVPIPHEALFLAGKAFRRYRQAGGTRTGVLPDFFIGAHAQVAAVPLLTRDPKRYRTYFPSAELIVPAP
jgi:predicted nucleic acid-binding protein